MKIFAVAAVALVALGCGDDIQSTENPRKLWLAPDMSEIQVKLQDFEPPPY